MKDKLEMRPSDLFSRFAGSLGYENQTIQDQSRLRIPQDRQEGHTLGWDAYGMLAGRCTNAAHLYGVRSMGRNAGWGHGSFNIMQWNFATEAFGARAGHSS